MSDTNTPLTALLGAKKTGMDRALVALRRPSADPTKCARVNICCVRYSRGDAKVSPPPTRHICGNYHPYCQNVIDATLPGTTAV